MATQWWETDPLLTAYHDDEWGRPSHDDRELFELLCLEAVQAGLSWLTVLRKRAAFKAQFADFDIDAVAKMTDAQLAAAMQNPGIIRNRRKLWAIVNNAQAVQNVQVTFGSFDAYVWQFTNGQVIRNRPATGADIPAQTDLSRRVAKDMKQRGFKFVGPTTVYSFLQAAGVVDDHLASEA